MGNEYEYRQQWQKDHTVLVALRLNRNTDGDIISAIENVQSKQGEIKRLVRLALQYEQDVKNAAIPAWADHAEQEDPTC